MHEVGEDQEEDELQEEEEHTTILIINCTWNKPLHFCCSVVHVLFLCTINGDEILSLRELPISHTPL